MGTLQDIKPGSTIKLLLLGDSGAGKTCGSCTFPGPVYLADFDGKAGSAASFFKGQDDILKNVEVVNYKVSESMPYPAKNFNLFLSSLQKNNEFPYRTIVVDSLTIFVEETLRWLIKENQHIPRPKSYVTNLTCPTDYNLLQLYLKELLGYVLNFPCNVIFTAHIAIEKDEMTGEILRIPLMPGKLAKKLPIYFEEVWRLYVNRDGKRVVQTDPDHRFSICRRQLNVPKEFEFKYSEIEKYINK